MHAAKSRSLEELHRKPNNKGFNKQESLIGGAESVRRRAYRGVAEMRQEAAKAELTGGGRGSGKRWRGSKRGGGRRGAHRGGAVTKAERSGRNSLEKAGRKV